MKISDLQQDLKRYMLYERGLTVKTNKAIVATLKMLTAHCVTEDIKAFTEDVIREFLYSGVEERGWEPKTFRNHWQNLKAFFDWVIKKGFLKKNPVEKIEKPKLKKSLPRCLSREDTLKILYYTASLQWKYKLAHVRNEAIVNTLIFTGIRLQELLNLKITDVNLADGTIFVRLGKGGKDRQIPIHPQLIPKLRSYFLERQKVLQPSPWFFTGIKSVKKLYQKDVRNILEKICIASGVKVTAHMFRHTFGKLAVEADFNIYKLKEIMGHEQVTTTQRYVSIASESIKKSFDKITLL